MTTTWAEQKPRCQGCDRQLGPDADTEAYIIRFPGAREIDSWFVCGDCYRHETTLSSITTRAEFHMRELKESGGFDWCTYFNQWMKSEPPCHGKKSAPPLHH